MANMMNVASYPALSPTFIACSSPLFFMQPKIALLHEKAGGGLGTRLTKYIHCRRIDSYLLITTQSWLITH